MNALVTGGGGFIGYHLTKRLLSDSSGEVHVIDQRENRFPDQPCHYFRGNFLDVLLEQPDCLQGIDTVFHLAWASVPATSTQNPLEDLSTNLVPTVRLFELCATKGVKRIVFISTGGAIYGIPNSCPISETHSTDPISAYGISKLAAEKYLKLFHRLYGVEYAILRPSVPYGEYQNPFGPQGAVAVFLGKILSDSLIRIWGDPAKIVRDFFHVSDLVEACVLAATSEDPAEIYNIGGGVGISLEQLLHLLAQVTGLGHPPKIELMPARPFDVPNLVLDITHANRQLNWKPKLDLLTGLQRTYKWIQQNHFPEMREKFPESHQ